MGENSYAICPTEWLEDARIKTELRLLLKISSLTADGGYCYASNEYLAEYFKTSTVTISRQISKLLELGYIKITYKRSGTTITSREIYLNDLQKLKRPLTKTLTAVNKNVNGRLQKLKRPLTKTLMAVNKNVKDNIISFNTISNNTISNNIDIESSTANSQNKLIVEKHELQNYILENCSRIQKMEQQLTYKQAAKLEHDFDPELVKEVIDSLENYKSKKIEMSYKSVYLTLRKWLNKEIKDSNANRKQKSAGQKKQSEFNLERSREIIAKVIREGNSGV